MRVPFLVVFLSIIPALYAAPPASGKARAELTLRLPVQRVLPGVPFDLAFEIRNTSSQPIDIWSTVVLTVKNEDGEVAAIRPGSVRLLRDGWREPEPNEVAPGDLAVYTFDWSLNWFFTDYKFTRPGKYLITARIGGMSDDPDAPEMESSNSVTLERIQPAGDDEVVWKMMQDRGYGQWPSIGFAGCRVLHDGQMAIVAGEELAKEVIATHSSSNYYPYAALMLSMHGMYPVNVEAATDAVDRFPASPVIGRLLMALGTASSDPAMKTRFFQKALETGDPAVRQRAKLSLSRVQGSVKPNS